MTLLRRAGAGSLRFARRTVAFAALVLTAAVPALLHAQATAPRTMISINPLGLPFKYVSGELERKVNTFATVGASGSYLDAGDGTYTSFEGKFRLYPNELAFQGFSIGVAAGITRTSGFDYDGFDRTERSETNPTIAVLADYNWLIGKTKRVLVGAGVGAKRIFGDLKGLSDINSAYPTFRFQVGVAY